MDVYDLIVVGSGGGGLCAALTAAAGGKRVIVLEKRPTVGGSTAMSGGVLWLPDSPVAERAGLQDSFEEGMRYFQAVVGDKGGPASSIARRTAFIKEGRTMVQFLERSGMRFVYCDGYSDYYDELPGGKARGRVLGAEMLGSRAMGEWFAKMQKFGGWELPINTHEFHDLTLVKRTWRGKLVAFRLALRVLRERLTGQKLMCRGAAVQGRMLKMVLSKNIPIHLNMGVQDFIRNDGRITGVRARGPSGESVEIQAQGGVLLNGGGFAHNLAMRERYQPQPCSDKWTASNPGETGELIEAAKAIGAATDFMDEAIWIPISVTPDGMIGGFHNPHDLAKPFTIVVDNQGRRFVNEACSYMEFGQAMYRAKAVPAWAILESRHRQYYPWGATPPGVMPKEWESSGYMRKGNTLAELAQKCGINAQGLASTVERFNQQAKVGKDPEFQRGARAYDCYYGDTSNKPNPSLGALERGPFYAVQLYPGDVGTFGGLLTDEHAAVIGTNGQIIPGLYATGNCTASVMGRTYPGAGASIAASFVYGFIAAKHALNIQSV
jgi:3-oxosteroid 1-dehydrogenase